MSKSVQVDGKFVAAERDKRLWTQEQLAEKSEVTARAIHRMESRNSSSYQTIQKVAEALGVTAERIRGQQEEVQTQPTPPAHELQRMQARGILHNLFDVLEVDGWTNWSYGLLMPTPCINSERLYRLADLKRWFLAQDWPEGLPQLKRLVGKVIDHLQHCERIVSAHADAVGDGRIYLDAFYKKRGEWNPNYDEDHERFQRLVDEIHTHVIEATGLLNAIVTGARRWVDSGFRAGAEKVNAIRPNVMDAPGGTWSDELYIPQYTAEEVEQLVAEPVRLEFLGGQIV